MYERYRPEGSTSTWTGCCAVVDAAVWMRTSFHPLAAQFSTKGIFWGLSSYIFKISEITEIPVYWGMGVTRAPLFFTEENVQFSAQYMDPGSVHCIYVSSTAIGVLYWTQCTVLYK